MEADAAMRWQLQLLQPVEYSIDNGCNMAYVRTLTITQIDNAKMKYIS